MTAAPVLTLHPAPRVVLGIDPGLSGALAFLTPRHGCPGGA